MCINSPARFTRRFNFYPPSSRFNGVVGVNTLNDKVGMSVEIAIFSQSPRMIGETCSDHIREDPGHNRRTQHIVQTLQSFS